VGEGLTHLGGRGQQIITVDDRWRCAIQGRQQVEQGALFGKADFQLVKIRPPGIYRCDGLRRVTDQKGMSEVRQEFRRPDMVDVMRKILEEDRLLCGA